MEYNELIKYRYSCRNFSDKEVDDITLTKIIQAGIFAPSARNTQPVKIKVARGGELVKLKECTKYNWNYPVSLIVCFDRDISYKRLNDGKEFGDIDTSIFVVHMMLEIYNLGLATTWIGNFDSVRVKEIFDVPDNYEVFALLPVGYAREGALPGEAHFIRKNIDEILF